MVLILVQAETDPVFGIRPSKSIYIPLNQQLIFGEVVINGNCTLLGLNAIISNS
jgi:hypothetical protein